MTDQELFALFQESLPENLRSSEDYDIYRYWELNGKPKNFEEAKQKYMYELNPDGYYHAGSVAYNKETGDYEWMKKKTHPTAWMEHYYSYYWNPEFRKQYNIIVDPNRPEYLKYIYRKQLGGSLNYLNFFN